MSFNSHRRNRSLLSHNRPSLPTGNRSLRKINQPPPQHWALIAAKQYYYQYNNMKAAIDCFEEYLKLNPQNLQALYLCAISYLHEQRPQYAIPKLNEYLSYRRPAPKVRKLIIQKEISSLSNIYLLLSIAYNKIGNIQKAFEAINQSIKNDSHFQDAYCYRAKLYVKVGEYAKGENDYKSAIKLNSKSWMGYSGLADCYRTKFHYQLAIKYYDKVISIFQEETIKENSEISFINQPNLLQTQLKRNICLYQNGDNEQSCKGLQKMLELTKSSQVYYYLALNQLKIFQDSVGNLKNIQPYPKQEKKRTNSKISQESPVKSEKEDQNHSNLRDKVILNLQYGIKAQTNLKICSKASKLLIKLYVENYQFYEAANVVQLTKKLSIDVSEYKMIVEGCMLIIKQKYEEGLSILNKLHKKISYWMGEKRDSETQKNSPREKNLPILEKKLEKREKRQKVNFEKGKNSGRVNEEVVWMVPILLLFKAYSEFFLNNFIECLETYEIYESHIRDYLGTDPENDVSLKYNKVVSEGILMLENEMVQESLQKFLECIDNYFKLCRGVPVEPILLRILGMIKIALSTTPFISPEINSKKKIFVSILEIMDHYMPAIKNCHFVFYYKGIILLVLGEVDEANDELEKCLKIAEQCIWKFLYVKGVAELERRAPKEAIKQFSAGLILEQVADLYLGRCIAYIELYNISKIKETVLIQKGFDDLQKFIELESNKEKISVWVTKILFYNGAFDEVNKSLDKIENKNEEIFEIEKYIHVYNGHFEQGGIVGNILINAFEGVYEEDTVIIDGKKHAIDENQYIDENYQKWLKILNLYNQNNYAELIKILQISLFQESDEECLIELRYNLVITYMLMGEFPKAHKVLSLLSTEEMKERIEKMENRDYTEDECVPDLEDELKGVRRLSHYLPYRSVTFPESKRIYVKISLPFPYFEKPNIRLTIDDVFLLKESYQQSIPKKIEAPWIRKITGHIQFTETILESDGEILWENESLSEPKESVSSCRNVD